MNRKMMLLAVSALMMEGTAMAQDTKLNPGKMMTEWGEQVTPENAWRAYPRPQLKRSQWASLNGLWDYAILPRDASKPKNFDGKILVPFAPESALSGVQQTVKPDERLWYRRTFRIADDWKGKTVLLHFDAVDWEAEIWLNGKKLGVHRGGSDPFHFDISKSLKKGDQHLEVAVWDPTDTGTQPRGKQVLDPKGIWYTPVTGIWQSVWLEPVEKTYIATILPEPDIDNGVVVLKNTVEGISGGEQLQIKVLDDGKTVAEATAVPNQPVSIAMPDARLWSPADPHRYQLDVSVVKGGRVLDRVDSYFAMRKIAKGKDELGYERMLLNNQPLFQYGPLDQGWWPDGLLTPPSEKAMLYDMEVLKKMGFNMLRKHIKVEPARYYYYADSIGLLVWQDMVSGFATAERDVQHVKATAETDWDRPAESAMQFEAEWKAIMDHLRFFPSIVVWVPFNEGWGQYDTKRVVEWTMAYDPSRIINGVSGWTDRNVGHMNDAHHYPGPGMEPASQNPGRIITLGEFGGLGWPIEEHLWNPGMRNWGYRTYYSEGELIKEYARLLHNLQPMIGRGLAAAVYTQTTDVEGEVNGLITYDRKQIKIDPDLMRVLHEPLYRRPQSWRALAEDSEVMPGAVMVTRQKLTDTQLRAPEATAFSRERGPVQFKKGQEGALLREFTLDEPFEQLQLRLLAHADVRIFLNGREVVSKFVNTKRHYDEINLSMFKDFLVEGNNTLLMEISDTRTISDVDLGLYAH
ncbi:glycoside hydrolase family 2 protein [Parapedobacter pyrenivorans]|nr:sugar-binding domain-containing protein [Parapedobacter pyrenivorans]